MIAPGALPGASARRRTLALVVAGALAAALPGCGGTHAPQPPARLTAKQIVERSKPAIVRVEADGQRVGTGFAIDPGGVIVTNLHVVAGSRAVRVTLLGGAAYDVVGVVAVDPERDLVLLDIDPATPMPSLRLGDSAAVAAGDPVVAIGNPLGVLDYTVSDGLISSVRVVSDQLTMLQISAPISQGSSGGPLFNPYGEVIGVATAIFTEGQNLNFAMPATYVGQLVAAPRPLTMEQFAAATATAPGGGDGPAIERRVPIHDLALLDGCTRPQLEELAEGISAAIELGAPLYNAGKIDECARIYARTAEHWRQHAGCAGPRQAFSDGLTRATALATAREQAWALRDTFDGLIDVMVRKVRGGASP